MRRLTLVRHAQASMDYPELDDFERPLTVRGRRQAMAIGPRLLATCGRPDLLVASAALRAITTARAFAAAMNIELDAIEVESRIYEARVSTLLALIRTFDDTHRHIVLFGHNPGFSALAHDLADCPFGELPTCGIATFDAPNAARWLQLAPGTLNLVHYLAPGDEG